MCRFLKYKKIVGLLLIILITALIPFSAHSAIFYIATNGNDNANGSINDPFRTLDQAASAMSNGDTCFIRGGVYHDVLDLDYKNGLTFQSFEQEEVIFDGTISIDSTWESYNDLYRTSVTEEIWQLFLDGNMLMPARWPNADLYDGSVWDQENKWGKLTYSSSQTQFTDEPTGHSNLSELDFSINNAYAVLNVGSWKSFARQVSTHNIGSSDFTISASPAIERRNPPHHQFYFLEGKLDFLDSSNEWFYENNYIYLLDNPDGNLRGKVQNYAFDFNRCDSITISGINFFATTVNFLRCNDIIVEHCVFEYPSCSQRMRSSYSGGDEPPMTSFERSDTVTFYDNIVRYANAPAVYMKYKDNYRVENCLFEYIDWECADIYAVGGTIYMRGTNVVFKNNTIHTVGASEVIDVLSTPITAVSNEVWNTGLVQNDLSGLHFGQRSTENTEVAYNWIFDSPKTYGIRFDAETTPGAETGSDGLIHHNVGWNTLSLIMQKGDSHTCLNNTAFDNEINDIIILSDNVSENNGSVIRNNAAEKLSSHRFNNQALTSVMNHSHNWNGYQNGNADMRTLLRDPDNFDFRPKSGSVLIDAGIEQGNITDGFVGSAPDIGAYESGASSYWIPGRKESYATRAIPPNGSTTVIDSADLMWRKGLNSSESRIYFSIHSNEVINAENTSSSAYVGSSQNNIFNPTGLSVGTYYWRVDEVSSGQVIQGDVWSFSVPSSTYGYTPIYYYDQWALNNGIVNPNQDNDSDGLNNLLEYSIGSDPNSEIDGNQNMPLFVRDGSNAKLIYTRRSDQTDRGINYIFEYSTDLTSGIWTEENITEIDHTTLNGQLESVTNNIPNNFSNYFMRMNIIID